jgi:sugar phosphate permease
MQKSKFSHYRWFVTSLVFFITLVNFIDRSAISFVIEPLKQEFHFSDTQFGLILSAFGIGYVLLTAFGGWLVDLWGSRTVWAIAAVAWSVCVGLLGFATGFWSFIWLRLMLGFTEGPHFPALTRTVGNWLPPAEQARALSLGLVAIPISAVIGAPLTSYLVIDFGWRTMFFVISGLGILWGIVWYFVFHDKPEESPHVSKEELEVIRTARVKKAKNDAPVDWKFILTHPTLIANNFAYFAFGYMLFFATLWLPGYFLSQHGLNLKSVGWYLTIPWLCAAIFMKAGGFFSDWLYKKTGSLRYSRSHFIWASQLLAAVSFLALSYTHSLGMSIFFLSLGLGFGFMPQPAFFNTNIDVAKERAGSAQGITSSCLSLAGILAPMLTGWMIDLTKNFQGTFLLLAGITGLAVIVVVLFHHPDREYSHSVSAS